MPVRIALFVAALLVALPTVTAAAPSPQFDPYIDPFAKAGHLSGSLLVADGEEIVFQNNYGYADYENCLVNTTETLFNIASVTKPITQIIFK